MFPAIRGSARTQSAPTAVKPRWMKALVKAPKNSHWPSAQR
jgi:hypothetical protein